MDALQGIVAGVHEAGGTLVVVSPQKADFGAKLLSRHQLQFELLVDSGNELADAFGLRHELPEDLAALYSKFGIDLSDCNVDGRWTLPLPARYVIDTASVIRSARVHADYKLRPEPEETLAQLQALVAGQL